MNKSYAGYKYLKTWGIFCKGIAWAKNLLSKDTIVVRRNRGWFAFLRWGTEVKGRECLWMPAQNATGTACWENRTRKWLAVAILGGSHHGCTWQDNKPRSPGGGKRASFHPSKLSGLRKGQLSKSTNYSELAPHLFGARICLTSFPSPVLHFNLFILQAYLYKWCRLILLHHLHK